MLETDPVVPCHAPVFDAELVWEADKRRFRRLVLSSFLVNNVVCVIIINLKLPKKSPRVNLFWIL